MRRDGWLRLGASVLAISTMFAGAACGTGSQTATGERVSYTGTGVAARPLAPADVHKELRKLEASYQGRIGAFAIDTGTGRTVGYRTHERVPSNSTFKAILCGAILHKARTTDPGLLNRTLHWTKEEVVDGSGITGKEENIKNGMTVARLCEATITTSDNTAANVLLEQVVGGPRGMTRYYRSLGDPVGRLDGYEPELNHWNPGEKHDTVAPAFMARDLQKLTVGKALVPQDRQQLATWMKATTTGDERIRAGVPKGWTVGDKTGTADGWYAAANDIAIAWPPSGAPVIIVVFTHRAAKDAKFDNKVIAQTTTVLMRGLGRMS
ncbi:class A beta-lactamase [Actinomadura logoneensis]|uniref:Class A beta-lactamase n=1 Tax=Actinomadura logoneensis TaxID=2293572 RepID=A0A372JKN7_9ACTN|nr:class A beta-lactamase [Actinomadura logoneensis]RFU40500.1 class A beta-lactamase [Actinomadura logoneensis]